jgi:hypothetical protein
MDIIGESANTCPGYIEGEPNYCEDIDMSGATFRNVELRAFDGNRTSCAASTRGIPSGS